jgi:hypothetical protein
MMNKNKDDTQKEIESGKGVLGIEFGSTRIKAVLIGADHTPLASGSHEWENRYENGMWTYSLEDVWTGLQASYRNLSNEVLEKYNIPLRTMGAIGFSGMMHGYMAFDADESLLVPFRTWRNTNTGQATEELTELFHGPWKRVKPGMFTHNPYNATISNISGHPLAGDKAFSGFSGGWTSSRVDLSSLKGKKVKFRFRIGTDSSANSNEWFLDDIRIYRCVRKTNKSVAAAH